MNRLLLILTVALQYVSALQLTRRALPGAAAAATAIGTQNALAAAKPVLVLGANGCRQIWAPSVVQAEPVTGVPSEQVQVQAVVDVAMDPPPAFWKVLD